MNIHRLRRELRPPQYRHKTREKMRNKSDNICDSGTYYELRAIKVVKESEKAYLLKLGICHKLSSHCYGTRDLWFPKSQLIINSINENGEVKSFFIPAWLLEVKEDDGDCVFEDSYRVKSNMFSTLS